jgi:hypothetical protein
VHQMQESGQLIIGTPKGMKREYTDEQRAAIRARFLAGREAARKRRENEPIAEITDEPESIKTEKPKKVVRTEKTKKS